MASMLSRVDNIIADAFSRLCVLLEDEDDEGEAEVETTEAPQEEEVDVDDGHTSRNIRYSEKQNKNSKNSP
jgi:hypothetical protein